MFGGPVKTEWTSWSVRTEPMGPGETWCVTAQPQRPFKIHWVIATTPGFRIVDAKVGNVSFIRDSATDLYYVRNWDHLASLGQLERVRVSPRAVEVGNQIMVQVTNENQFGKHRFECGFIGEQIGEDHFYRPRVPYPRAPGPPHFGMGPDGFERMCDEMYDEIEGWSPGSPPPIAAPLILPPQPADRECPECGVPAGLGCLGVKRGTFHKRREKDKHR